MSEGHSLSGFCVPSLLRPGGDVDRRMVLPWTQRWAVPESPSWPRPSSSYPKPHWHHCRCQPLPRHFIGILLIQEIGYFQPRFTDEEIEGPTKGPI